MALTVQTDPPICEYCGEFIEDQEQRCPACDGGDRTEKLKSVRRATN